MALLYPPRWPASKMLAWYQDHFDTVELNNSFDRLPSESALENWRSSTPAKFRFAVKGSRFLRVDLQTAAIRFSKVVAFLPRHILCTAHN
jgi:uncharacterized protein YecE (DUF72 family)